MCEPWLLFPQKPNDYVVNLLLQISICIGGLDLREMQAQVEESLLSIQDALCDYKNAVLLQYANRGGDLELQWPLKARERHKAWVIVHNS